MDDWYVVTIMHKSPHSRRCYFEAFPKGFFHFVRSMLPSVLTLSASYSYSLCYIQ
jgi:hypothetical protein